MDAYWVQGTLIRVWDTRSGVQLHELRRGAEKAEIYSVCFNEPCNKVAVSSDHGTIHVFCLAAEGDTPRVATPRESDEKGEAEGSSNQTSSCGCLLEQAWS